MLILVESLAMCFILLVVCVIGIANGPVGAVYFYEPEVQERVVELGVTTKAWHIPGTEELMPYIPKKTLVKKWVGTVIGYPIIAAILSAIMSLF